MAYLAQRVDKSSIEQLMRIAWRTVGRIVERVVARRRVADPLDNLEYIGVDELSYRKHHHYVTVVVDHRNERVAPTRMQTNCSSPLTPEAATDIAPGPGKLGCKTSPMN